MAGYLDAPLPSKRTIAYQTRHNSETASAGSYPYWMSPITLFRMGEKRKGIRFRDLGLKQQLVLR